MKPSVLYNDFRDALVPCFIFMGTTILLIAEPQKHAILWFGFVALIPILLFLSHRPVQIIALTLITLLPIVDYGFLPHFNFTMFNILAPVVVIAFWLHASKREESYYPRPGYPFKYLLLSLFLSTIIAPNIEFSLSIILTCIFYYLVFRGLTFSLLDRNSLSALMLCLLIPLLASSFIGVIQGIYGPYSLAIAKSFNTNVVLGQVAGLTRVSGTLDNSLDFGQYLSVMCSFVLGFLVLSWKNSAGGWLLRVTCIVSLVLAIIALLGTLSRTSILSFAAIVALAFIVLNGRRAAVILAIIALVMILFPQEILGIFISKKLLFRFQGIQDSLQVGRGKLWKDAFNVFLSNPILGVGTGNLNYATGLTTVSQRMVPGGHVESVYLSYLVSNGVIGFLGLVALTIKVIKDSYLSFKESLDPMAKSISFGLFLAFVCNSMNMITNPASLPTSLNRGGQTDFYMFWILLSILFIVSKKRRPEISSTVLDISKL